MPISSATCMKRLLNTSSMIGSASRPSASRRTRAADARQQQRAGRVNLGAPAGLDDRRGVALRRSAPAPRSACRRAAVRGRRRARCASRRRTRRCARAIGFTRSAGRAVAPPRRRCRRCPGTTASSSSDSTTSAASAATRKPKWRSCSARNASDSSAASAPVVPGDGERRVGPGDLDEHAPLELEEFAPAIPARRIWRRRAPRRRLARAAPRRPRPRAARSARPARPRAPSSSGASTLAWRSARTSATPMPNADSTPASG